MHRTRSQDGSFSKAEQPSGDIVKETQGKEKNVAFCPPPTQNSLLPKFMFAEASFSPSYFLGCFRNTGGGRGGLDKCFRVCFLSKDR